MDFSKVTVAEKIRFLINKGYVLAGSWQYPVAVKKVYPKGQRGRYIKFETTLTRYEGQSWRRIARK